jgi:thymidylate synthase
MWAYIRTNDMWGAWPLNVAGLRFFQCKLAEELNVKVGELSVTSGSAHIYDYAIPEIDEYLKSCRAPSLQWDPKGDWWFAIKDGKFVADHFVRGELVQTLKADTVDQLERQLRPFVSNVSHALFLGRELQRLEQSSLSYPSDDR